MTFGKPMPKRGMSYQEVDNIKEMLKLIPDEPRKPIFEAPRKSLFDAAQFKGLHLFPLNGIGEDDRASVEHNCRVLYREGGEGLVLAYVHLLELNRLGGYTNQILTWLLHNHVPEVPPVKTLTKAEKAKRRNINKQMREARNNEHYAKRYRSPAVAGTMVPRAGRADSA